ncbi:MAG: nitrate reductase [Chloroflexi bacterium]|nr:nitrate reductase [Chloroflexota bacterium]
MRQLSKSRLLVSGVILTGIVLIIGAILIISGEADKPSSYQVLSQLSESDDECVVCHAEQTPGIANQYARSDHFKNDVSCADCHTVDETYPGAQKHPEQEYYVLAKSSPAKCQNCHRQQVEQFNFSRHALPSYVAYAGSEILSPDHLALYQSIPEGGSLPGGKARNSLHALEGEDITKFACETCHNVGKPNPDQSVGDCTACHLRHEFSLEQVRKPETCNACHIGPDHPQWEIYQESPHGIAYMTMGDDWNWDAEPGTLTTVDFAAPTCATCHFSGFGLSATTHDVGDRLSWFLAASISAQRPSAVENRLRMQNVCTACHSAQYIQDFYTNADALTTAVNDLVMFSDKMMQPLKDNNLLTAAPFDEPIDYVYYEVWHHWGRTTKFGAWMQGPDYTQWHGAYELLKDLSELRELIDAKLVAAGLEPLNLPEGFPSLESARAYLYPPTEIAPTETPTEVPTEAPAATEEPTEVVTETATEVPTETATQAP